MANQHANLHELTKQLDVLTWNARSVLNALIRSAMKAGSSSGFTVQRAGETIQMTKEDIFKIYNFYEKWESLGYPNDEETFNALLDAENAYYQGSDEVTESLVKHAKTIWQDTTNKGSDTEYWINRIRTTENVKWFTNTAPIPLNIRTPIYDENLSTKTYDSYETYLFPSSYYAIDTLGYVGDGSTHTAGGNEWLFDVQNRFSVHTDVIQLGYQDNDIVELYASLYSDKTPKCALEGGINSGAFDECSFAYGIDNQVNNVCAVAIGGKYNHVTGSNSGIIAGHDNNAAMGSGVIAGGVYNKIGGGTEGFAANSYNNVGGYSYEFTRYIGNSGSVTECDPTYTPPDRPNCTYYYAGLDATTGAGGSSLGLNQFYVSNKTVTASGMLGAGLQISSGSENGQKSPFDFKISDSVTLFAISVTNRHAKGCKSVVATVTNIEKHTAKGIVPMSSPDLADGYVVTINKDFTAKTFTDLGGYSISGGYVCRNVAQDYPMVNTFNEWIDTYPHQCSDSAALGYNNIAAGRGQVVVGASNIELLRPNFIVGSGSSYIDANDFHRENSFVSSPHYTYMMSSKYIVSGVAQFTTAYIHGDQGWESAREYDEDYLHGVEKYAGFFAYSNNWNYEDEGRAVLRVFHEKSLLAIGNNGLVLYEPKTEKNKQTRTVWNELYSTNGGIAIHSGSFLESGEQTVDNNWLDFYNNWTGRTATPGDDHSITIWAKGDAGMHGGTMWLHSSNYIHMECNALTISGNTRAALSAQPTNYGVECYNKVAARIDTIKDCGHFYVDKSESGMLNDYDLGTQFKNLQSNGYHVFTSSKLVNHAASGDTYDVAQFVIPANLLPSCNRAIRGSDMIPHPMVISNRMVHYPTNVQNDVTGRDSNLGGYLYEELAYLSDIKTMQTKVMQNMSAPAYTSYYGNVCRVDMDSLVAGYSAASVQDTYLASLTDAAAATSFNAANTVSSYSAGSDGGYKLVRSSGFSGVVNKTTTVDQIYSDWKSVYLHGVELNPAFRMEIINANNRVAGVTYLAYAPALPTTNTIYSYYQANLSASEGAVPSVTLFTSKFSHGGAGVEPTNLKDVWAVTLNQASVSSAPQATWKRIIRDLIITVSGGTITVEFFICRGMLHSSYSLPSKLGTAATTTNRLVANTASGAPCANLASNSQVIHLPIDPVTAAKLSTAVNGAGVVSQLHGRAYFTGNVNVSVVGTFAQSTPALVYDRSSDTDSMNTLGNTYYGPTLAINIGGLNNSDLSDIDYYVCLEGAVQNG